jgi:RHH-type proline utilization regulon transcriptional repressor/proline dehydrogenase/delta 1-pyrroline-5-carboxylate dehydrogenase
VVASAFDSAGQRCSALRVLCLQEDIADRALELLLGAVRELRLGPPHRLSTDVGPVIDAAAHAALERHIEAMAAAGRRVHRPLPLGAKGLDHGTFVAPAVIELASIGELKREVFGPVLHVVRYRRAELPLVVAAINATGYGLTLGVQSRIDETIEQVVGGVRAGNLYVNRNMVGAVVGVQPFGGEGLSGTGPKAGGPLYLRRLVVDPPPWPAAPAAAQVARADGARRQAMQPLVLLRQWLAARGVDAAVLACCDAFARRSPLGREEVLPGPTGERNTHRWCRARRSSAAATARMSAGCRPRRRWRSAAARPGPPATARAGWWASCRPRCRTESGWCTTRCRVPSTWP